MTLTDLAKLREQGIRPAGMIVVCLGLRALIPEEIACTGTESRSQLLPLMGLSVTVVHSDWSIPELTQICQTIVSLEPAFLLLHNDVTGETIKLVRTTGEVGAWEVTCIT